jgi:acetylornithine deacetylase/succinyl-diaminopimelate desuccinylase-like protein
MADLELDRERFVAILAELVRLGPHLVNAVEQGQTPREGLAADVILAALAPHIARGALTVERVAAPGHEDRPNLLLTLPGSGPGRWPSWEPTSTWCRPTASRRAGPGIRCAGRRGRRPLRARGTTDCLGHVALLTELLRVLTGRGAPPPRP